MFFGYPAAAVGNNWLHETIVTILNSIHRAIMNGQQPLTWPLVIPEIHRQALRRKTGIRDRLADYQAAFLSLNDQQRRMVNDALSHQNRIAELLNGTQDCLTLEELPEPIRQPARRLFEFAFGLLVELRIRDQHYEQIDQALPDKICPFCGINGFDAPGSKREDYDHYLPESKYTFAGCNLWNLVPMCKKCNALYKHDTDPIWDDNRRRRAVNPYNTAGFSLDISRSNPSGGTKPYLPQWEIAFVPTAEEAETWDQIFSLREHLKRNVFDRHYTTWIKDFASWCITAPRQILTADDILSALKGYEDYLSRLGRQDRAFFKLALCRLHQALCAAGNREVINVLLLSVQSYATRGAALV